MAKLNIALDKVVQHTKGKLSSESYGWDAKLPDTGGQKKWHLDVLASMCFRLTRWKIALLPQ
jgi:hypothetical protein